MRISDWSSDVCSSDLHGMQLGLGIFGLLLAFAATEIGMDHVSLDRAGTDDRHLDHQIVEPRRFDPRQHGPLRAALNLEDAERVRLLDHRIDRRVVLLQAGHADLYPLPDRKSVVLGTRCY